MKIYIIRVLEEESEKEAGGLFDQIITENFSNLGKETYQIQYRQRFPIKFNKRRSLPRRIVKFKKYTDKE